jgi:hypothetical protein
MERALQKLSLVEKELILHESRAELPLKDLSG